MGIRAISCERTKKVDAVKAFFVRAVRVVLRKSNAQARIPPVFFFIITRNAAFVKLLLKNVFKSGTVGFGYVAAHLRQYFQFRKGERKISFGN